jgi:hypothetical protein
MNENRHLIPYYRISITLVVWNFHEQIHRKEQGPPLKFFHIFKNNIKMFLFF